MQKTRGKLDRFWQELKRRKVFGVFTTYAATAYIIIEVTNNLAGPLNLSAWIAKLVIIVLAAGLPIVIILSWIFDFTSQGIKKTESFEESNNKEIIIKPAKKRLRASYVLNAILIITVIVLAYPKIFKQDTLERLRSSSERISVAVMPFQNMTNDTLWNVWQDGIQNELINKLTNSEELKVRQSESTSLLLKSKSLINYASITPSVASSISKKLDANIFIIGSIKQAGATIRLNAQLIDSKTKEAFKSYQIDGTEKNILSIIDSLSMMVKNILIITRLENGVTPDYKRYNTTNSPEAYRYFIYGNKAFNVEDYPTARRYYLQALALDTNFFSAAYKLSFANMNPGLNDEAKKWCLRIYRKRDQLSLQDKIRANLLYAFCFESKNEQIKYLKQLIEFDDQSPEAHFNLSLIYFITGQYDKTITEEEKTLEIYKKWRSKPAWFHNYTILGMAYHQTGQHKKAKKLYKKAEQDFPDNWAVLKNQVILSLDEGDTVAANRYIQKFKTVCKGIPFSEAHITADICDVYASAGIADSNSGYIDKSEEYCYKLLSLEPENPDNLFGVAYWLIVIDRNINKALELMDRALKVHPDNYDFLLYKGWGLYKQGKYKEAVDILQRSWDLRLKNAFYDDFTFRLLDEAKKATAGQK
jgi:TolB-like protein/Tfp pilus assembly protein PilF